MKFRVVEIDNQLTAIFDSKSPLRNSLLSQFLVPSTEFVVNILYDISGVESGNHSSYAFENSTVYIELFKDHITIEPYIEEHETEVPKIEIPVDSAKLLLFKWGVALQRWQMKQKKLGI